MKMILLPPARIATRKIRLHGLHAQLCTGQIEGSRIILHFIHSLLLDVIDMKQELREMTDMIFIPFYVLIFAKVVRVALLLYSEG